VLVIDNCTVHKTDLAALVAMVEAVGEVLLLLAPYCPIDNPIECAFRSFKACWRRHGHWLDILPVHLKIKFRFDLCARRQREFCCREEPEKRLCPEACRGAGWQ
jgi:hypothetical protein